MSNINLKWNKFIPNKPTAKQIAFLSLPHVEALYGGAAGGGKFLKEDGVVLTPFGWKNCKFLNVGDSVNNPDGSVSKIIQLKAWERLPKVTVHFHDGTSTDVAEEHLWLAWRSGKRKKRQGRVVFGNESAEVVTTKTLEQWMKEAHRQEKADIRPNWPLIPVCCPQRFNVTFKYKASIDPYILGSLLGDGCITGTTYNITCSTEDYEEHWNEYFNGQDCCWELKKDQPTTGSVRFRGEYRKELKFQLERLKLLGTNSHTKFIPKQYLYGSIPDRVSLLQGLIDTDGFVDSRGQLYYCSVSKKLREGVIQLVQSLGGTAKEFDENELYIKLPNSIIPCRLQRKLDRLTDREPNLNRRVVKITKGKPIKGRCLTVSHPNGLYITNDFIVTHNSDALLMNSLQYIDVPGYAGILFRRKLTDHKLPDSILNRALKWLAPFIISKEIRYVPGEHTLYVNGGGSLTFGYLDSQLDRYRYQSAQFQFCVSIGTKVLMDTGKYKPIEKISVGDRVQTLEGPKPVTRLHGPKKKFCVKLNGQIQGYDHRVLTSLGWISYSGVVQSLLTSTQSCEYDNTPLLQKHTSSTPWKPSSSIFQDFLQPSAPYSRLPKEIFLQDFFSYLEDDRNDFSKFGGLLPSIQQLPKLSVPLQLFSPLSHSNQQGNEGECVLWGKEFSDSQFDCVANRRLYGGHGESGQYAYADYPLLQGCAGLRTLTDLPSDALETFPTHNPLLKKHYHPYTTKRLSQRHTTFSSQGRIEPFGFSEVYDITVAESSHYITKMGYVNSNCGMDECTQIPEEDYTYLFSRLRKTVDLNVPLKFRAATNPGGISHQFIKERFGIRRDKETGKFKGHVKKKPFIPAFVADNPFLDIQYLDMLKELSPIERARLEEGDWDSQESAIFDREYFSCRYTIKNQDTLVLVDGIGQVRTYSLHDLLIFSCLDSASSEKTGTEGKSYQTNRQPSFSVCGTFALIEEPPFDLIWLHNFRSQCKIPFLQDEVKKIARKWRPSFIRIQDTTADAGILQNLEAEGLPIKAIPQPNKDKVSYSIDAQIRAKRGRIWLPEEAGWLGDLESELFSWTGDPRAVNDQIDVLSSASSEAASCGLGEGVDKSLPTPRYSISPMAVGHTPKVLT